jgi:hypothetical protein
MIREQIDSLHTIIVIGVVIWLGFGDLILVTLSGLGELILTQLMQTL